MQNERNGGKWHLKAPLNDPIGQKGMEQLPHTKGDGETNQGYPGGKECRNQEVLTLTELQDSVTSFHWLLPPLGSPGKSPPLPSPSYPSGALVTPNMPSEPT